MELFAFPDDAKTQTSLFTAKHHLNQQSVCWGNIDSCCGFFFSPCICFHTFSYKKTEFSTGQKLLSPVPPFTKIFHWTKMKNSLTTSHPDRYWETKKSYAWKDKQLCQQYLHDFLEEEAFKFDKHKACVFIVSGKNLLCFFNIPQYKLGINLWSDAWIHSAALENTWILIAIPTERASKVSECIYFIPWTCLALLCITILQFQWYKISSKEVVWRWSLTALQNILC